MLPEIAWRQPNRLGLSAARWFPGVSFGSACIWTFEARRRFFSTICKGRIRRESLVSPLRVMRVAGHQLPPQLCGPRTALRPGHSRYTQRRSPSPRRRYGYHSWKLGTRSYIVRGKGNMESFMSCSHGAGRAMSPGEAKRRFSVEDHVRMTAGVECRKDTDVIDETPAAYKPIESVMAAQSDLVEIIHTLRQVMCVKG